MRLFMTAVLLLTVVGCAKPTSTDKVVSKPAGSQVEGRDQLRSQMVTHFGDATLVQTAIIERDIESLRHFARRLTRHTSNQLPDTAQTDYQQFLRLAEQIALVAKPADAALPLAKMVQHCGDCHLKQGVMTKIPVQESIPEFGGDAGMMGHIWAADRMWEGLIGPIDQAWNQGAVVLSYAPLSLPKSMSDVDPEVIAPLRSQLRDIGREAQTTFDRRHQAQLYGRLLKLCASCHGYQSSR